jgi:transcription-repair coupling factor (superfamily II helicase)
MLAHLSEELANLPPIAALADQITCHPPTTRPTLHRLAPLMQAARGPVVAALAQRMAATAAPAAPLLYVTATAEQALHAAADLALWLAPEQVQHFPASDALPYEHMAPGVALASQRLRTLEQLANPDTPAPLVIVAPVGALLQPTLAPGDFAHATTTLEIDDRISQDTLIRRWLDLGYRMAPLVEEAGEMARRGGIVDIWPPSAPQPVRIEWFGNEIDSLRSFDPLSQRSEQRLPFVTIAPPLELPLWKREEIARRLQEISLGKALRREVHEEWVTHLDYLQAGRYVEGGTFFAPFFMDNSSLLDHLPSTSVVLLSEAAALEREAAAMHEQAEEKRAALVQAGELLAEVPRPYLLWENLFPSFDLAPTPEPADVSPRSPSPLALVDLSNHDDETTLSPSPSWNAADSKRGEHEEEENQEEQNTLLPTPRAITAPAFTPTHIFGGQVRRLVSNVVSLARKSERVVLVTTRAARIQELVSERLGAEESAHGAQEKTHPALLFVHGTLSEGWNLPELRLTLYTDTEISGLRQRRSLEKRPRRRPRSSNSDDRAAFLRDLSRGDYVVHIEHGIGIYEGLIHRTVGGVEREYLDLRYADGERIYVPVDQVDRVARYVGTGDTEPRLTKPGTRDWEQAKRKARSAVRDLANELLAVYAQRKISSGHAFSADNEWQHELEDTFPYTETDDQLRAMEEVKGDMESLRPMDRLICGDVGFGKTEVALRAAFKAIQDSKQVAVLVPTTVLAQQHYETFRQRMAQFPVVVEMLSRFRSQKEQQAILQQLMRGEVDIIIGTHRLLSTDVVFKNLGLLIVDEEQRFGVRHKERLKQLRTDVDILTLTATPIPRTLHMALTGIRDMSVIDTPPERRVPIKTYVAPFSKNLVRDAVRRELGRGGQVFFLHNRVHSIYRVADQLREIVPEARVGVAHGQLEERQLEQAMLDFFNQTYDVLVCTTIIENGLDVPNANTLIVDDAPLYGLAQLYQLRGRVGRSTRRAYAYLLYRHNRHMTKEAAQRLEAIQEATDLGAGFRIAMRDLEIRGTGNILGTEQSGYIAAVGFDLYSRLLEQAVKQLKQEENRRQAVGEPSPPPPAEAIIVDERVLVNPLVTISLPLSAYLPEDYIPDDMVRLGVYQRMIAAQTPEDVHALRNELRDRFGELPPPAAHVLIWLHIKVLALHANVSAVTTTDEEFLVRLPPSSTARARLGQRFRRDSSVVVSTQFVRLRRDKLAGAWAEKLVNVLEVLGGK